jgi:hypothetical protein
VFSRQNPLAVHVPPGSRARPEIPPPIRTGSAKATDGKRPTPAIRPAFWDGDLRALRRARWPGLTPRARPLAQDETGQRARMRCERQKSARGDAPTARSPVPRRRRRPLPFPSPAPRQVAVGGAVAGGGGDRGVCEPPHSMRRGIMLLPRRGGLMPTGHGGRARGWSGAGGARWRRVGGDRRRNTVPTSSTEALHGTARAGWGPAGERVGATAWPGARRATSSRTRRHWRAGCVARVPVVMLSVSRTAFRVAGGTVWWDLFGSG